MQQPRLLSFLFSLCLHAGVVAFALFLPQTTTPIADLSAPAIDVNIYTIGSPGKAPTTAPSAPKTPAAPVAPPQVRQDRPAAPVPVPDPARQRPETPPVPIPPPDKPEPPKPEPPKPEPPAPEPVKPEPPAPPKPEPAKPAQNTRQPDRSAVNNALRDLGLGQPDPGSIDDALKSLRGGEENSGDGPGGAGGLGGALRGTYMQSLVSRIKPHWEYGGRADRRNPTALVDIRIARDGTILEASIVESSGDAAFDGSVLKAVNDTAQVEPPPTAELARVRVPFAYEAIKR